MHGNICSCHLLCLFFFLSVVSSHHCNYTYSFIMELPVSSFVFWVASWWVLPSRDFYLKLCRRLRKVRALNAWNRWILYYVSTLITSRLWTDVETVPFENEYMINNMANMLLGTTKLCMMRCERWLLEPSPPTQRREVVRMTPLPRVSEKETQLPLLQYPSAWFHRQNDWCRIT